MTGKENYRAALKRDANGCVTDHKGNKFTTVKAMCRAWHVDVDRVNQRLLGGWSLERALSKGSEHVEPTSGDAKCIYGEYYASAASVARRFNMYKVLVLKHWDHIEDYLTSLHVYCYGGKIYRSVATLSAALGMEQATLRWRLDHGWSIERAMVTPVRKSEYKRSFTDHHGNVYNSKAEMVVTYGIPVNVYNTRIKAGWSVEMALTTPVKRYLPPLPANT